MSSVANVAPEHLVVIHPLCVAAICDHFTRVVSSGSKLSPDSAVIGLLLGDFTSTKATLFDVCDLIYTIDSDGNIQVNEIDTSKIISLRTAVYSSYSVVGWYAVSTQLLPAHSAIHQAVAVLFKSNPIFLLLSPNIDPNDKQLPLQIFRQFPNEICSTSSEFKLESSNLEKSTIDEVTKRSQTSQASGIEVQNSAMATSIQSLSEKIEIIVNVLQRMKNGTLRPNHDIIRRCNKICSLLATINTQEAKEDLNRQVEECLMLSYLSTATKTSACISELTDAYSMLYFAESHASQF